MSLFMCYSGVGEGSCTKLLCIEPGYVFITILYVCQRDILDRTNPKTTKKA